jgi:hypothetical protein
LVERISRAREAKEMPPERAPDAASDEDSAR